MDSVVLIPPRVLVVEDDALEARLVTHPLTAAGFDVRYVEEPVGALGEAVSWLPDAMVSDVLMPSLDGFELCRAPRRRDGVRAAHVGRAAVDRRARPHDRRDAEASRGHRRRDRCRPVAALRDGAAAPGPRRRCAGAHHARARPQPRRVDGAVSADATLAERFADQAALALASARLFEDSERRRRAAESLAEMNRALSEQLDPARVAERVISLVSDLLSARSAAIYRLDDDGHLTPSAAAAGFDDFLVKPVAPEHLAQALRPPGQFPERPGFR